MSGKKGLYSRSSLTGGRRKKGATGRKELEDPVTQISALQGSEEHSEGVSGGSPQKGRYISQLSQSPSPPLHGKLKKQGRLLKEKVPEEETSVESEVVVTSDLESCDAREDHHEESQDQEIEKVEKPKPKIALDSISIFLQELERHIQSCGPLPKCPRQTSRRACRFELPMDVTDLEGMRNVDYLLKYCIVAPAKEQSYKKIYKKHCKMRIEDALKTEFLQPALEDHFCRLFGHDEVSTMLEYLDWEPGTNVQEKTFVVMAAFFERFLCQLQDKDSEQNRKEELEQADFSHLEEKLDGVDVQQSLLTLLTFLQNS